MVAKSASNQGGFTIIELLIALTVLIIGLTGIVQLQMSGVRASSYSRHATEASVLAEDRMEVLRTAPLAAGTTTDTTDAQGIVDPDDEGYYTRESTVTDLGSGMWDIEVKITWRERGSATDEHTVTLRTRRVQ